MTARQITWSVGLLILIIAIGCFVFLRDNSDLQKHVPPQTPPVVEKTKATKQPTPFNQDLVESLSDEQPDIEWSYCMDDMTSDACMEAIDPLFHNAPVLGSLSWVQLFEKIDTNINTLTAALNNPDCGIVKPESFQPSTGTKSANVACGARAFAELGVLAQRCGQIHSDPPSAEARLQHAQLAGETDLQVLDQLEQSARMAQLEHEWLRRRCTKNEKALYGVPNILPALQFREQEHKLSQSAFGPYAGHKPWRWNSEAYIEQAVLLGDYRAVQAYVRATKLVTNLQGPVGMYLEKGGENVFESVIEREQAIDKVIDDIVQYDPKIGFTAKAEHLILRHPNIVVASSYAIADTRELNESPYRDSNTPILLAPREDWYQRALDIATYQIAADRLAGIPDNYRFTPLQSKNWDLYSVKELLDDQLSANDWEYASQQANKLIAEVNDSP